MRQKNIVIGTIADMYKRGLLDSLHRGYPEKSAT